MSPSNSAKQNVAGFSRALTRVTLLRVADPRSVAALTFKSQRRKLNRTMNALSDPTKGARGFARVVTWSAALSMALTAAILASVRQVNPTVEFKFSVMTVVAFLVAGLFTAAIFRRLFNASASTGVASLKRWPLFLFFAIVLATLVASMVFALRGVSREKRMDIAIGAGLALVALTFGGYLGWRTVRFLEADEKRNRREDRP